MTLMTDYKSFFTGSLLLATVVLGTACQQKKVSEQNISTTAVPDSIAVVPFELETGGWGYRINRGSKHFIYQDIIPSIPGRRPFQTKEDALRVGNLMVEKMRSNGSLFPKIDRKELLEMKIAGVE